MTLNLAWAKQYPEHEIAKKIQEIVSQYWNVTSNPESAQQAVEKMKVLQGQVGITSQDGIIWRATLSKYESIEDKKEKARVQGILTELDASLYGSDLNQRTEKAQKDKKGFSEAKDGVLKAYEEGGIIAWAKEFFSQGKEVLSGGKVTDAKWVEYTIKKQKDWKIQYVGAKGEIFELRENKMVSVTEEGHKIVLDALKGWEGTKYKEADWRYFEVKKDEGGNLTAFRSSRTSWAAEYYNIDTKKWEENTDQVKTERTRTASRKRLWEFMDYTGRDTKTYWEITLNNLDAALRDTVWPNQEEARRSIQTISEDYAQLSQEDKTRLWWVKLADYRRMTEDSSFAAQILAGNDKPTILPAGLWEDGTQYQRFDNNVFVFRNGEKLPRVIQDGKVVSIDRAFNDSWKSYDLPDWRELRVILDNNWVKKFLVSENKNNDPRWVLRQDWKLEEIKRA
jgi:hypothetical protein